mmetsp:Transcript_11406/g.14856  ORF Transcript_11406/g.14856 Transcript_11406/m.14856 type:complete len:96 (-) Transcript_11406:1118-1405(-)
MATDPTLLGFGALLAVGGSVGYAKKGSLPSLLAGCGSGLIYAWASQDIVVRKAPAQALSALLVAVMFYRFKASGKFMPAGMVGLLAAAMLAKLSL